jgi:hypothetical protein
VGAMSLPNSAAVREEQNKSLRSDCTFKNFKTAKQN